MSDQPTRDVKLIQYLNEAYGKERQLETALQAHIAMTTRDTYKKRLRDHLKETKSHARDVERRIKKLGGSADQVSLPVPGTVKDVAAAGQTAVRKGAALAQGPVHMLRGTGEQEKLLKNAKTEYANEAEEIATYTAIEALADAVGDRETAQLARRIRRDEQRMASFLERLIPTLTRAVATEEIPAAERRKDGARSSSRASGSRAKASASGGRSGSTRAAAASGNGRSTTRRAASKAGASNGSTTARRSTAKSGSRATTKPGSRATTKPGSRATTKSGSRATTRSGASAAASKTSASRSSSSSAKKPAASRSTSSKRATSGSKK
jgi:ferritin-like metal-binding protein YciE